MTTRRLQIIVDQDGSAKRNIDGLIGGITSLGTIALGVAAGGIAALSAGIFTSIQAASEAQDGQAELAAVIASTGGIAGVTADMANNLASSLQDITRFSDDAILAGENMLLTFTNIGQDVFPDATRAMLDMAQKFGSVEQASLLLGKALNAPTTAAAALRRNGIQLTHAQELAIQSMVEMGDIAGAQRIILAELNTQFGGLAEAAGSTFAGKLDILKNKFGDIQEVIGGAFLPGLTTLADRLVSGLNTEAFQAKLQSLADETGRIMNSVIDILTNPDIAGVSGFGAFDPFLNGLIEIRDVVTESGPEIASSLKDIFAPDTVSAAQALAGAVKELSGFIEGLGKFSTDVRDITSSFRESGFGAGMEKLFSSQFKVQEGGFIDQLMQLDAFLKSPEMSQQGIIQGLLGANTQMDIFIGKWGELQNAAAGFELPPDLTPGSPSPFEISLRGVTDALSGVQGGISSLASASAQLDALKFQAGIGSAGDRARAEFRQAIEEAKAHTPGTIENAQRHLASMQAYQEQVGRTFAEAARNREQAAPQPAQPPQPIHIEVPVVLDGGILTKVVSDIMGSNARGLNRLGGHATLR